MVIIAACIPVLLPLLDLITRVIGRKPLPPARPYRPSRHITIRWTSSGMTEGRASIPAPYRVLCSDHAPRVGSRGLIGRVGGNSSAGEEEGPDSDWRRLDDANTHNDEGPDFEKCFGLTDTEEDKLMIWFYGRLGATPRYDGFIIADENAPPTLPGIPGQVHTPRIYPYTCP